MTPAGIPFLDLRNRDDAAQICDAITRVVTSGRYVLGPEVEAFETEFAAASGARFAIGVGSGTDAITLLLSAAGVGREDEVLVPALTAAFTGLAVVATGARPVFVDVDATRLTLDPKACEAAITPQTRAMVPVHLYGQPADTGALFEIAERHGIAVVEDCCQAHLATADGVPVGTRGAGGAFSFYPTKNIGALGDGGAIITNDPSLAERVGRLRNGGRRDRDHHLEAGRNSRLDEIQAAVLRVKLPRLAAETERRRALAATYRRHLREPLQAVPELDPGHVYHLFPVLAHDRDGLQADLARAGVETLVHYPVTLPQQDAFASFKPAHCPVAARAARQLLSLPLRPTLNEDDVVRVANLTGTFHQRATLA